MRAAGGKKYKPKHGPDYWEKLRQQFKTCTYCHSGAYQQHGNGRSVEMQKMAGDIEYQEQILKGEKYAELRKQGYFEPRASDRLLKAGQFVRGKFG